MLNANQICVVLLTLICVAVGAAPSGAETVAVSAAQETAWLRWTLPLPKQITIPHQVSLRPEQVDIRLRHNAGDVEKNAAAQLEALFEERTGTVPDGQAFRIILGVCDEQGRLEGYQVINPDRLRSFPNWEQAYAIRRVADNVLALTALDERGVYYAAQTLRQLLEAKLTKQEAVIPLLEVLDWPDIAERGQWGGSAMRDWQWLAAHKMNVIEFHIPDKVNEDGTTTIGFSKGEFEALIEEARIVALKRVPIIPSHMDQLSGTGLYAVYPELHGADYGHNRAAPCYSQPNLAQVIAQWMEEAAARGATDISAWLSEAHSTQCPCEECQEAYRQAYPVDGGAHAKYVLEVRALVKAWRKARQNHPGLGMRILLTQGSYKYTKNEQVLPEIPPEVGVTYYHGDNTYDSSREPMIYPLLEEYVQKGGWLGVYPQLTASYKIVSPWTGPQFIRYRMNEFVDKGLKNVTGYATPDNQCYEFNVLAAAEWSWNAKGRTAREFSWAWATREGYEDPEAVADWAVKMGPVGWNLYGSRVPHSAFFGLAAAIVKQRKAPQLGEGMYRYYPTVASLDHDIATCEWAAKKAQAFDAPELVAEARIIGGMVGMLRAIYDLRSALSKATEPAEAVAQQLNTAMVKLEVASQQATDGLNDWKDALEGFHGARRFDDTIQAIQKTASDIGEYLSQFAVRGEITEEQQTRLLGPPRFESDKLHVGILGGGYGAAAICQWLDKHDSVEARYVAPVTHKMIAPCDVLIIPQPIIVDLLGESEVQILRGFVSVAGGGLIVTHDAAGFDGQPAIIPEICTGGTVRTRQTQWTVAASHPVTEGIAADTHHGQSYYDQIQLQAGPQGTVVAQSAEDGKPIVIAGEFGEGRYVAIGLAIGLAANNTETEPAGAEAQLLLNSVSWAGR